LEAYDLAREAALLDGSVETKEGLTTKEPCKRLAGAIDTRTPQVIGYLSGCVQLLRGKLIEAKRTDEILDLADAVDDMEKFSQMAMRIAKERAANAKKPVICGSSGRSVGDFIRGEPFARTS
jgi:hypothetical protein